MDRQSAEQFLRDIHSRIDHGINPCINVTEEEWLKMKELVKEHQFPVEPRATGYGFYIAVYGNSDVPEIKPDRLLAIDEIQFPKFKELDGVKNPQPHQIAENLTHTDDNKRILDWYGFKPLEEISYYVY